MSSPLPAASIIVPTYHEAANIRPLVERVFSAIGGAGIEAELIIVDDDSRDGTEDIVKSLAQHHPVRLVLRHGTRGLSAAVIEGFQQARFDRFVVLDADLQHPPEMIPVLLRRLETDDCDFVIGTRYASGAGVDEHWPFLRRVASRIATWLAAPLMPLSDPMSGFFAIRRATWQRASGLKPIGYKIGLELYVKGGCRRPAEIPIRFSARSAGTSKLSVSAQLQYVRHLFRLYLFRFPLATLATVLVLLAVFTALALVAASAAPSDH
ncbi:MAG: polyprenol monophosphomannose synthase [Phycisphaerae bacterium]